MAYFFKDSYKFAEKELFSLAICNVGHQKCIAKHQWGPGVRDHYLIHYVISGNGYYKIGIHTYTLKAGDSFLIYPNKEVLYYADNSEPWEYVWVGFKGNDAPSILKATAFTPETPVTTIKRYKKEIQHYMNLIYNARGNNFLQTIEMAGYLYILLSYFMREDEKRVRFSQTENYVVRGIDYIASNYDQPITVDDIADHIGISRSQLFRSFKTVLSQSPKTFLTEFRIEQACYLLTHSDLSMSEIAESVGFNNSLYFSKAFHKQLEMPPTEYARQNRTNTLNNTET